MKSRKRCNLIVDSCCDLPRSVLDDAGVQVLQFPFTMNDGEHLDDMWASLPAGDFYGRLRKGEVSGTAQIPLTTLASAFEEAALKGEPTVYLGFTSGLSGNFETAERLAQQTREQHPGFELHVVDTQLASIAEGLLVYEAIRQRERGLSAQQMADWAREARWHVNSLFTLEDLGALRRGGRIPDAAASIGDKLKIKPVLSFNLDGALALSGVARGHKKALKSLVGFYENLAPEQQRTSDIILVGSADAAKDAEWVEEHLERPRGAIPAIHCQIGPVIGSHVGPGMVAIAMWGPDRREDISIADRIASKFSSEE